MKLIPLAEFRKEQNLTMDQMAERLDISKSMYEKVEYGERNPSGRLMRNLKKAFPDADIDRIFFDEKLHDMCG